jgi:hypothetical protein
MLNAGEMLMKKNFQQLVNTTGEVAQWIGDRAGSAGEAGKALVVAASNTSGETARAVASSVQSGLNTAKANVAGATQATGRAVRAAGDVAGAVGGSAIRTVSTVGKTLLDQNGDGHLDQADVKIATEKTAAAVKAVASEVVSSDLAKDAAAGAAIGAVLAVPIPLVGPLAGAVVGAVVGSIAHLRRKK